MHKKDTSVAGKYTWRERDNGGYIFYWKGRDGVQRSYKVLPADVLKKRYAQEIDRDGRISQGLRAQIGYLAILDGHERSIVFGRKHLGVDEDEKNGKLKKQVARWTTLEEVQDALKAYYPQEKVARFLGGEEVTLNSPNDFASEHRRDSQAIKRRFGGLFKVMEEVYPGLYKRLCIYDRSNHIDVKALVEDFQARYGAGQMITPHLLKNSTDERDRILFRDLRRLSKRFGEEKIYKTKDDVLEGLNWLVFHLTSIPRADVGCSESKRKIIAHMAEELTDFVFNWALVLGIKIDDLDLTQGITRETAQVHMIHNGRNHFADLRVGDTAIDVKSGSSDLDAAQVKKIIKLYTPGNSHWVNGDVIQKSLMVMQRREETYKDAIEPLIIAGINILPYAKFHRNLLEIVEGIQQEYPDILHSLRPRLHDLAYLIYLSEEIALKPFVLTRAGIKDRVDWSRAVLSALTDKSKEKLNGVS